MTRAWMETAFAVTVGEFRNLQIIVSPSGRGDAMMTTVRRRNMLGSGRNSSPAKPKIKRDQILRTLAFGRGRRAVG